LASKSQLWRTLETDCGASSTLTHYSRYNLDLTPHRTSLPHCTEAAPLGATGMGFTTGLVSLENLSPRKAILLHASRATTTSNQLI
jgi:hypothetical protein